MSMCWDISTHLWCTFTYLRKISIETSFCWLLASCRMYTYCLSKSARSWMRSAIAKAIQKRWYIAMFLWSFHSSWARSNILKTKFWERATTKILRQGWWLHHKKIQDDLGDTRFEFKLPHFHAIVSLISHKKRIEINLKQSAHTAVTSLTAFMDVFI